MPDKELRFWVNDFGASATGTVDYGHSDTPPAKFEGWVGIVDEQDGGMVAYAHPKLVEELVILLNRAESTCTASHGTHDGEDCPVHGPGIYSDDDDHQES